MCRLNEVLGYVLILCVALPGVIVCVESDIEFAEKIQTVLKEHQITTHVCYKLEQWDALKPHGCAVACAAHLTYFVQH